MRIRVWTLGCYTTVQRVTRNQHQFPEILGELREVFKKGHAVMAVREQERWREAVGKLKGSPMQQAIVAFLKRRKIREVNQYGWVLLKAIFGDKWKPGRGKDQIAAFRAIPRPFTGKIKTRKDAQIAMERAKLERFRMLQNPEK